MAKYHGDTFDHRGYSFRVSQDTDTDMREPWKEYDGHGVISEWTRRDKAPSERILCSDRSSHRFYDVAATLKIARRDQWGCTVPGHTHKTKREAAACAVDRDYEYLRRFCAGDWQYLTIGVHLIDDNGEDLGESEYLGGVESSDPAYLDSIAEELADQIVSRLEVDEPDIVLSAN